MCRTGQASLLIILLLLGEYEARRGSGRLTRWRPGLLHNFLSSPSSTPVPQRHPTPTTRRPIISGGGVLNRPITTPQPLPYEPPPVPEDTRIELSVGTCVLHLYEPCYNSKLLFYFFHPDRPTVPVLLNASDPDTLTASGIDTQLPTKLIIHGYSGSLYYEPTFEIAKAYLAVGGVNVIILDWGAYTNLPCYPSAVINTWQSGKCAAQAIYNLAAWSQIPGRFLNRLHLIGFSLGAHVAGFAASYLRPARIGRITGLDPALPFFASLSRSWKLDANDARFVDVIHTNVGILGKIDHTGHVDFYPNGGSVQPACNTSKRPLCNHLMAPAYFAESITSTSRGFWGRPCYSFLYYILGWCDPQEQANSPAVKMGEKCPRSARGVYFVTTGAESPYGLGPLLESTPVLEEQPVVIEPTAEEIENEQAFQNNTILFRDNYLFG